MSEANRDAVNRDIESLISLDIPPVDDRIGRHVVKFTIACAVVFALAAIGGLTYALRASFEREDRLANSLSCALSSALTFDVAMAESNKLKLDLDVAVAHGLVAVTESPENLAAAVAELRLEITGDGTEAHPGAEAIKASLDTAVAQRRAAVAFC